MSLHTLANHIQSAGRGEDKVLVHMTPKEVGGLQSLAMAHGGSLTINPETGLPEAGILSSLLPMIAGFALGPAGFGLMTSMQAGLTVGALTGVATGSLKQGVMAGLGAYGGAGLGQGLMAQGAQGAAGAAVNSIDDIALASKNAAANSQIGNTLGNTAAQGQVFGQPAVNAANATTTAAPNMGLSAYTAPKPLYPGVNFANGLPTATPPVLPPAPPVVSPAPIGMDKISSISAQTRPVSLAEMSYAPGTGPTTPDMSYALKPTSVNPVVRTEILPGDPALAQPQSISGPFKDRMSQVGRGFEKSFSSTEGLKGLYDAMPTGSVMAAGATLADGFKPEAPKLKKDKSLIRPYEFTYGATGVDMEPYTGSAERLYFNPQFTALTPYAAPGPEYAASGGLMGFAVGGAVEDMAAQNAVGANTGYPMANLQTPMYSDPSMQRPHAVNVVAPSANMGVDTYTGEAKFAAGGISHLGDYSDGGRLLKGPGDGVSDSIPASIGNRQPARLADGEFVVPARIVSEIGNGSTEAGARKLYAMMDRVQKARRKTVGKDQVARNTKAEKLLPA